ncbi:hypothetical protein pb186bvf_010162 [Paramecium bursaria]
MRTKWTWQPTQGILKSLDSSNKSLASQVCLPNSQSMTIKIDSERELQHSTELGWNWHKSWNLPNVSVKLGLDGGLDAQWPSCKVSLVAAKKLDNNCYEEVGLEGPTHQDLSDGKAFFAGIKFNSTTYNHQGQKFVILIMVTCGDNIILTLSSPSIFVDSRKSARDEHRQIQYIQPFEPKCIEKSFCKKEKHFNDIVDAPIENNETGLHNYLTAPNIRNKIKHPLFLAIKFSKCIQIYHQREASNESIIKEFQRQLIQKDDETDFVIAFTSNNNRIKRKIEESLIQLFQQSKIRVVEKKNLDDNNYFKLENIEDDYANCYQYLQEMMNRNDNDEDSRPILKKVQMDKLPTKVFNGEEDKVQTKIEEVMTPQQELFAQTYNPYNYVNHLQQLIIQQNYMKMCLLQQQYMMQMFQN